MSAALLTYSILARSIYDPRIRKAEVAFEALPEEEQERAIKLLDAWRLKWANDPVAMIENAIGYVKRNPVKE